MNEKTAEVLTRKALVDLLGKPRGDAVLQYVGRLERLLSEERSKLLVAVEALQGVALVADDADDQEEALAALAVIGDPAKPWPADTVAQGMLLNAGWRPIGDSGGGQWTRNGEAWGSDQAILVTVREARQARALAERE